MPCCLIYKLICHLAHLFCFLYHSMFEIYSCHLHAPLCGIFGPHSVNVAHYAFLIRVQSTTNCDEQLSESNFQTSSNTCGNTGGRGGGSSAKAPEGALRPETESTAYKSLDTVLSCLSFCWRLVRRRRCPGRAELPPPRPPSLSQIHNPPGAIGAEQ